MKRAATCVAILLYVCLPRPARADSKAVENLGARYLEDRQAAVKTLSKSSAADCRTLVPILVKKVQDGTWFEQQSATAVLQQLGARAKTGGPGLAQAAVAAAKASDWGLARLVVDALKRVDPDSFKAIVPHLLPLMRSKEPGVRWQAVSLLGRMQPLPATVGDQLIAMFKDKELGAAAIEAAGSTAKPSPKLIKALTGALTSAKSEQALAAILAFRKMGPRAKVAVPGLIKALRKPELIAPAAQTLKAIGPAAAPALPQLLQAAKTKPAAAKEIQAALTAIKRKNILPTAKAAAVTCTEGGRTTATVEVVDPDDIAAAVTVAVSQAPKHGTAEVVGPRQIEYRSKPGFVGRDQLTFNAADAKGKGKPAKLTITVKPDTVSPKITRVQTAVDLKSLTVTFSEPLAKAAAVAKNYKLSPAAAIKQVKVESGGNVITLKTAKLKKDQQYRLTLTGITDRAKTPNAIKPAAHTFKATALIPGLTAAVYSNTQLKGDAATHVDAVVNYPKGLKGRKTNYSVRWTGKVKIPKNGKYTFYAKSDDGIRLWVNGKKLVDAWKGQGPTEYNGSLTLQAGKLYDVKMEYYQGVGGHYITLSWAGPGIKKQIIPKTALFTLPSQ